MIRTLLPCTLLLLTLLLATGCGLNPEYVQARIDASNQEVSRIFGKVWSEYKKGMTPQEVYALWHRNPLPRNSPPVFPCSRFHVFGHGAGKVLVEHRTLGGFYSLRNAGFRTYTFIYDADLSANVYRLRQWDPLLQDGLYATMPLGPCVFQMLRPGEDLTNLEPRPVQ